MKCAVSAASLARNPIYSDFIKPENEESSSFSVGLWPSSDEGQHNLVLTRCCAFPAQRAEVVSI
jgi:hypothetical protein